MLYLVLKRLSALFKHVFMFVFSAAARYLRLYIALSLHVASAVSALATFTRLSFGYDVPPALVAFIFLSSTVAYNLAKYGESGLRYFGVLRQRWHDPHFRFVLFISGLSAGACCGPCIC